MDVMVHAKLHKPDRMSNKTSRGRLWSVRLHQMANESLRPSSRPTCLQLCNSSTRTPYGTKWRRLALPGFAEVFSL